MEEFMFLMLYSHKIDLNMSGKFFYIFLYKKLVKMYCCEIGSQYFYFGSRSPHEVFVSKRSRDSRSF